jgi:hypothetical protein
VSLPPVGVCIEHVQIEGCGLAVSRKDIAAAEARLGVSFPPDYVAFLLNYNGGWISGYPRLQTPEGKVVRMSEAGWQLNPLDQVRRFRLRPDDLLDMPAEHLPALLEPVETWLTRYTVIGRGPDLIDSMFLGVAGVERGYVRFLDTSVEIEVGIRYAQANTSEKTFCEFLASLCDPGWWDAVPPNEPSIGNYADDDDIPF